jgi:hypothetical protein
MNTNDERDDQEDEDVLQVLLALTKIVSRLNAVQPDHHLQATLARAQRIIERSMPDALKEISFN